MKKRLFVLLMIVLCWPAFLLASPFGGGNSGTGTGLGDVTGPATNSDGYIPQWDGADSKKLKGGVSVGTFAPALTVNTVSAVASGIDTGANDDYACNLSPAITSYVTGTLYRFKANTANTGAATITFNSIAGGAKAIKKTVGGITTALADNDIVAGQWVDLVYDGTNMQMISQVSNRTNAPLQSADIPANAANTSGTASNVSGTPALPNGTTATTQSLAANDTKLATDAYVDQTAKAKEIVTGGGNVDAITANYTIDKTLADGIIAIFRSAGANTSTTPTFAPDGLTAHTIVKAGGVALVAGNIGAAGAIHVLQYDLSNTRWELLNPVNTLATLGAQADMGITGKTDSTSTTSSTVVASATGVKAAYDLANGKAPAAGSTSVVSYGPTAVQSVTCTDSGNGSPGALTITPTTGLAINNISLTVSDADGCAITMSETGATEEAIVYITNVSAANTATYTTAANVLTLMFGSPYIQAANETIVLKYKGARWLEIGRMIGTAAMLSAIGAQAADADLTALAGTTGGITRSGENFTFPGTIATTQADGSRVSTVIANTGGHDVTDPTNAYQFGVNDAGWFFYAPAGKVKPTLTNVKTYMGADVNAQTQASGGAGVTCNWALGSTCVITAHADGGATTVTMTNPVAGQVYRIYVIQGTTPIALPTLSPTVTWVSSAPTFSGTSTQHDAFTCQYIGTTYFCGNIGNGF